MSDHSASLPTSPAPCTPPIYERTRTNTLVVTPVPKDFFRSEILDAIKTHFGKFGEINQWVPLTRFARIMIVFRLEDAAENAKLQSDPLVIGATHGRSEIRMRIYRANPSPLLNKEDRPEISYLHPPDIEKNFLISPPGSPPVGWEPIKEDPPNSAPLAADLIAALNKLTLNFRQNSREVLLEPEDDNGVGVYVEDYDADVYGVGREQDWVYGEPSPARMNWRPAPTAMPPMSGMN